MIISINNLYLIKKMNLEKYFKDNESFIEDKLKNKSFNLTVRQDFMLRKILSNNKSFDEIKHQVLKNINFKIQVKVLNIDLKNYLIISDEYHLFKDLYLEKIEVSKHLEIGNYNTYLKSLIAKYNLLNSKNENLDVDNLSESIHQKERKTINLINFKGDNEYYNEMFYSLLNNTLKKEDA